MSDEFVKEKRSKRIHDEETQVKKQVKIAKGYGVEVKEPHKYAKKHAMNCGNPKCILCSNPRKVFKQKTIQEQRLFQKELQDE